MTTALKARIAATRNKIATDRASHDKSYKFKVGKTLIRLMPGVNDPNDFSRDYGAHYIKDAAGDIIAVVGDAEICYDQPCPVRAAIGKRIHQLNEMGASDSEVKATKEWLAKRSNVINAQILSGDEEKKGKVVRLELSQTSFDNILNIMEEADYDEALFARRGMPILVTREGTGAKDTRYSFSYYPKADAVPDISEAARGEALDLQTYVDSKFGSTQVKALNALSGMLGYDVNATALGAGIAATAALSAPKPSPKSTDEDLLHDISEATDAEFEEPAPDPAAKKAAPADELDDILADIDDL